MAGLNEVRLLGNLGVDPELRYTTSGTPVSSFRIATTRSFVDKNGDVQEQTEWHNVVAWQGTAESLCKHKKKGDQLLVLGYLQTREYEDKDGNRRWQTEVVAQQVIFTGKAPSNRAPHPADDPGAREPGRRVSSSSTQKRESGAPPDDDFDFPPEPPGDLDRTFNEGRR